ncbi:hypothetical protein Sjap_007951 [Stephania japonica]|uniref:Uncharacterized protein n=1 Tax=Stephania japonica TaxID=461633 RepID=A0AAP0JQX6_9MAGN
MNNKKVVLLAELNKGDNLSCLLPLLSEGSCGGGCKTSLENQLQNLCINSTSDGKFEITLLSHLSLDFESSSKNQNLNITYSVHDEKPAVSQEADLVPTVIDEEINGVLVSEEAKSIEKSSDLSLNGGGGGGGDDGESVEVSTAHIDSEANNEEFDEKVVPLSSGVDNKEELENLIGEGSLNLVGEEKEATGIFLQRFEPVLKSAPLIKPSAVEPIVKETVPLSEKQVMNNDMSENIFNFEEDFPPLGSWNNKTKSK